MPLTKPSLLKGEAFGECATFTSISKYFRTFGTFKNNTCPREITLLVAQYTQTA